MLTVLVSNSLRLLHDAMTDQAHWQMQQLMPVLNAALKAPLAQRDFATVQAVIDESRMTGGIHYIVVTDREGDVVASSGWTTGKKLPKPSRTVPFFSLETSKRYDEILPIVQSGQKLGSLHLGIDLSHIVSARRVLLTQGVVIAVLELVLSALILILIGYWLTRHLTALTNASLEVAAGNFEPLTLHESNDDIGQLGAAFNRMSRTIADRVKELTAAKEIAEASEKRLRSITTSANDAIIMMNAQGSISYWNPAAERILGYRPDEAVGQNLHNLLAPERYIAEHQAAFPIYQKTGRGNAIGKTLELYAKRKNGEEIAIALSLSAVFLNGEWNAVGILRDVSELKRYEAELRSAKEAAEVLNTRLEESVLEARRLATEAEKANAAKSEFLASMSHEIRTPMNAIIGMADLLWESPLNTDQKQYVRIFKSAGENLLNLINDILDISKVESGQLKLDIITFDLANLMENTCEIMAIRAHEKGLELTCVLPPDIPYLLNGDPVRLRQVLINLIGNAIKFTEQGEIVVSVKDVSPDREQRNEDTTQGLLLQFSVSDSGIGIAEDKLEAVFDKFTQADSSLTRKYEGSGLGLTISRQLVMLMGGRIWVDSRAGMGSTFYFTAAFSIQPEFSEFADQSPTIDLNGLRTLVIDDNATNRLILREMLGRWGAVVTEVDNGASGISALQHAQETGQAYALVLLDSRMPDMNGFAVAKAIREDPALVGVTIAMLTSESRSGDIDRSQDLGLAAYLIKPIKRSALQEAIQSILKGKESERDAVQISPPVSAMAERGRVILLVEDSDDNRLLIQAYMKKTPHVIDIAENGKIAVDKFKNGLYDIVLMDMQMPVMDGYTATQIIRAWEQEQRRPATPIIALTAYALKDDERKSIEAGCTAHLTKPIKKDLLLETIREWTG